jgi:hypothetical protein
MQRILPLTAVLAVLAMLTRLPLAQGADYPQPTYMFPSWMVGFTGTNGIVLDSIPITVADGRVNVPADLAPNIADNLNIVTTIPTVAGTFYYSATNPAPDIFYLTYPFDNQPGSANGLSYVFISNWAYVTPKLPYQVYGLVAGGSLQNFSLPTTGSDTYCGTADYYYTNAADKPTGASGGLAITVNWQTKRAMTLSIAGLGQTTSTSGYTIETSGISTVSMATYGTGSTLNGQGATLMVHFFGPGAVQLSGVFKGATTGDQWVAGWFYANLIPGNPDPKSCTGQS